MPALIVFDLDGTLIDSHRDLAESTNELLSSYGAPPLATDDVGGMVGEGARTLIQRALAAANLDVDLGSALERFLEIYDRRLLNHTRPYDEVPELIAWSARIADLAVLTNKPSAPTRALLDAFDLTEYFKWVIGGDASFPRKPDPAGLRYLMTQAGTAPGETVMVGDSMIDVQTARNAGVRACAVLYGFGRLSGELMLVEGEASARTARELRDTLQSILQGSS